MKPLSFLPLATTLVALAGCNRQPRGAEFFAAHPDEARTVVASCTDGSQRGPECDNAKDGLHDFTMKQSADRLLEQAKAHGG